MQAADGANGRVHHRGLQFCKLLDKSSPLLSNAINNNERLNMTFIFTGPINTDDWRNII
jgi:type VI secretion system Hcp family effector